MAQLYASAQLARCHRSGEHIYFSIGKAQDFHATLNALEVQIPDSARRYDTVNKEWRVAAGYERVLEELFTNFPTILRNQSGSYLPPTPSPYNGQPYQYKIPVSRTQGDTSKSDIYWLAWMVIASLCVGLLFWFNTWFNAGDSNLFQRLRTINPSTTLNQSGDNPASQSTGQPTNQLAVLIQPTPTQPAPTPNPNVANATVLQMANLRTGPGTDYEVSGQVSPGQPLTITGQIAIPGSYSWYRLDNNLWIYSQLVSGPSKSPPVISQ